MSTLETADDVLAIMGVPRHEIAHRARAVSEEGRVYILHSDMCMVFSEALGRDLRDCVYSKALDNGIDLEIWKPVIDRTVAVAINSDTDKLEPRGFADA